MKINIYGPEPDMEALAELLKHVPADGELVYIKAPLRNGMDRRPCQHPGWLFYDASVDNKVFISLIQTSPTSPYQVKIT